MSEATAGGGHRARLLRFYAKYAPEKASNIDKILAAYTGNEDKLMKDLVAKYGPEPPSLDENPAPQPPSPPPPQEPRSTDGGVRQRLVRFYGKYAPERLGNVDRIMEHYRGKEDRIIPDLVAKYGPEPPAPTDDGVVTRSTAAPADYRGRLTRFYQRYAPDKVGNIDAILKRYEGREEDALTELVKRYGPEPSSSTPSTPSPQPLAGDLRRRLLRFLEHYAPEKASQTDAMLAKYTGKEEEMMKALVAKFGPELPESGLPQPPATPNNNYLARVESILRAHAPDKLGQAPAMVKTYAGRELELIEALVKKLGPEPSPPTLEATGPSASTPSPSPPPTVEDYTTRLTRLMAAYAPERLGQVPSLLAKYAGREEEMLAALVAKLGPEPSATTDALTTVLQPKPGPQASNIQQDASSSRSCQDLLRSWIGQRGVDGFRQHSIVQPSTPPVSEPPADARPLTEAAAVTEIVFERLCLLAVCIEQHAQVVPLLTAHANATAPEAKGRLALSLYDALQVDAERQMSSAHLAPQGGNDGASARTHTNQLPFFLDGDCLIETAQRAQSVVQLCQHDVLNAMASIDQEVSASIAGIAAWARDDAARIRQLVVDRKYHQRLVIERALAMIASVETNIRADLWRVREIEAQGRWLWFKERRREIALLAKPPQLQAVEHMFDRWKDLVAEQQEALVDGDIAHRVSERFGHALLRSPSPLPSSAGYWSPEMGGMFRAAGSVVPAFRTPMAAPQHEPTLSATPRSAARHRDHHQHYDAVGSLGTPRGSSNTPRRSGMSMRVHSNTTPRSTDRRRGSSSPQRRSPRTNASATTPRRVVESTEHHYGEDSGEAAACQHPKAWNLSTPRRTLSEHPSKAHVTSVARHLPPKLRIGTTKVCPFSFSSPAAARGKVATRSPMTPRALEDAEYI